MSENQRFPIGRTLTEFGDSLSTEEWENPSGAGEWREVEVVGGFIQEAADYTEELQEYLNQMRTKVVGTFDVAITTMTLFNDFMFLLPNFMNAVMTYIAQLVSNALEAYLRLGMHILIVPPDFGDAKYQGFPTTDLHLQAENVYKKFYDSSDPYLPYNVPFQKDLAEQMIERGAKVENKIEKFLLKKDLDGTSLSKKMFGIEKNETLKSDFIDFNQSIENLSRPIGFYDAIFLYFSHEYNSNIDQISKFVESIASLANLFQLESLTGLHNDFDNILFRSTRSKISILTNQQMRGLPKTSNKKYEKIDSHTNKLVSVDDELKNIIIVEADPFENMPLERFNRLKEFVENEIQETKRVHQIFSPKPTGTGAYSELAQFGYGFETRKDSKIQQIEETLRNNSFILKARHEELKENQNRRAFYKAKYEIAKLFNDFNWSRSEEEVIENLKSLSKKIGESIKSDLENADGKKSVFNDINEILAKMDFLVDNDATAENSLDAITKRIASLRQSISKSFFEPTDALSIKTPTQLYEEPEAEVDVLTADIEQIEEMIYNEAVRIYEEQINSLSESVRSKKLQLAWFEKKMQMNPVSDFSPENTTHIIEHHRNYKIKNKGIYQNHLDKFISKENKSIVDYARQAFGFIIDDTIPDEIPTENFIYEFSIRRPPTSLQKIQTGMYVHVYEKGSRPGEHKFLGDGFVTDEHAMSLQESGDGSWIGVNFSDLVGTTATIKTLQKKVNAFANMFTPNNTFLTEMIRTLREIRERILEMIDIIDNLLVILNLSVNMQAKVWGKYCREEDLKGYDKLASDLTSTEGFISPIPKRDFKPSNHNKIAHLLRKIEKIDPLLAEQIKIDIDADFLKTESYSDRKDKLAKETKQSTLIPENSTTTYSSDSIWNAYGLTYDVLEHAEKIKLQVNEELDNIFETANNTVPGLGSSLFSNVADMDFVDEKTLTKNRQLNKVKLWRAEIYAELSKIEPTLSNEFGFSMVFLSYLPKNQPFYPVRYLAEFWGLVDEDGAPITTDRMKPLDPSLIAHLMYPPKTQSFLESLMTQTTIDENPSNVVTEKPDPIDVSFTGHRVANPTNFNWYIGESTSSDYFEEISTSPNYRFRIKEPLGKGLHGVRVNQTLELPEIYGPITESFTYRFEAIITVEFDSAYKGILKIDEIPKLNKLEIHMGVFLSNKEPVNLYNSHEKAFSLMVDNGSDVSIQKFGRRKKKRFISQLAGVQKNQIQRFQPYILIGNKEETIDMKSLIFTIEKSQIYFYRSR